MKVSELALNLKNNIKKAIIGKDDVIDKVVIALLCNGHILLEDIPGTGKTTLAKALSLSLDCEFKRIQFTPDLLPSDLTGINFFNRKEDRFEFRKGSIFTNVLLADEINRATPRTQSSLLECMDEKQATIDGLTYRMSEPFFVIATQNPIETQGTFPLPEAQLDRFFMQLKMGYPGFENEMNMLNRYILDNPLSDIKPVLTAEHIVAAQNAIKQVKTGSAIKEYVLKLVEATRTNAGIRLGASPRGSLALLKAAQGMAAINDRNYVIPDDVKAVAVDVLAHRLICRGSMLTRNTEAAVEALNRILTEVPVPVE